MKTSQILLSEQEEMYLRLILMEIEDEGVCRKIHSALDDPELKSLVNQKIVKTRKYKEYFIIMVNND